MSTRRVPLRRLHHIGTADDIAAEMIGLALDGELDSILFTAGEGLQLEQIPFRSTSRPLVTVATLRSQLHPLGSLRRDA